MIEFNLCKDLDLCSFLYVSYSEKRFNQIYRALYEDAMLVSLEGTPISAVKKQLLSFAIKSISYHLRDRIHSR